jgi:hypothetical protein
METVTLKMKRSQATLLKKRLARKKKSSLHDLMKDFCGTVRGPKDMSTRPLTGYGRD